MNINWEMFKLTILILSQPTQDLNLVINDQNKKEIEWKEINNVNFIKNIKQGFTDISSICNTL